MQEASAARLPREGKRKSGPSPLNAAEEELAVLEVTLPTNGHPTIALAHVDARVSVNARRDALPGPL